jgi:acetylglutamate kinase
MDFSKKVRKHLVLMYGQKNTINGKMYMLQVVREVINGLDYHDSEYTNLVTSVVSEVAKKYGVTPMTICNYALDLFGTRSFLDICVRDKENNL